MVGGLGYRELPLQVDRAIMEDAVQSEVSISTRHQEAWVPGLPVDPGAVGDACQSTARGHDHTGRENGDTET